MTPIPGLLAHPSDERRALMCWSYLETREEEEEEEEEEAEEEEEEEEDIF